MEFARAKQGPRAGELVRYTIGQGSPAHRISERLRDEGVTHTPDGAPYSVSSIRAAMVGM